MSDHTPGTARKSTYNFGIPASANSDLLHTDSISTWISGYPVQCIDSLQKLVNNTVFSLLA